MKKTLIALTLLAVGLGVWAAPLTATWVEGKVEKQSGSAWVAVNVGDTLDSASVVRLGKSAMAEFSDKSRKLVISTAGVFSLDALTKAGTDSNKKRSGTLEKLARIVDPKAASGQAVVGGVRGDLIGSGTDQMSWAGEDDDASGLMAQAQSFAHDEKYGEAADAFAKAAKAAQGDQKEQALYGQAWSFAQAGSTVRAIKTLRSMSNEGAWSVPRALLLARLDLESGASAEAESLLNAAIASGALAGGDLDMANSMLEEARAAK